jgi:hypothetical protein
MNISSPQFETHFAGVSGGPQVALHEVDANNVSQTHFFRWSHAAIGENLLRQVLTAEIRISQVG